MVDRYIFQLLGNRYLRASIKCHPGKCVRTSVHTYICINLLHVSRWTINPYPFILLCGRVRASILMATLYRHTWESTFDERTPPEWASSHALLHHRATPSLALSNLTHVRTPLDPPPHPTPLPILGQATTYGDTQHSQ